MATVPPLYTARPHMSPLHLLNPLIAGVLVVMGTLQADPVTVVLGGGLGLYIWLTRHARYEVFPDRLVVSYMAPRRRTIPLADIEEVQVGRFPLGGQGMMIRRKGGWRMLITPADPERFAQELDQARRRAQQ